MSSIGTYFNLQPFELLISQREVEGHEPLDKFGELPNIATPGDVPADIWEGADTTVTGSTLYPFSNTQFSGSLIVGKRYYIFEYQNGDDFTNIGASSNDTGVSFVATGTTPTTWTNNTIINPIDIDRLSSNNVGDDQIIMTDGLIGDGTRVTGYAKLSGQTPVNIYSNPDGVSGDLIYYWRIFRMENEASIGNDLTGVVYCYIDTSTVTLGVPGADTDVKAIINNGNNQTLMTILTIPKGKIAFLYRGEGGISKSGGASAEARMSYRSRRFGKVFKIKKKIAAVTQGSSNYQDRRSFQDLIPPLTDVVLRVDAVSANDLGIFGTLDVVLIDQELLPSRLRNSLGLE